DIPTDGAATGAYGRGRTLWGGDSQLASRQAYKCIGGASNRLDSTQTRPPPDATAMVWIDRVASFRRTHSTASGGATRVQTPWRRRRSTTVARTGTGW